MAAESDRPTKASGVAQPAAAEPPASKVGDKRRNRWDQSNSAECAVALQQHTVAPVSLQCCQNECISSHSLIDNNLLVHCCLTAPS